MSVATPPAQPTTSGSPHIARPAPALPQDLAASAAVLGLATAAWFGWGSSRAPGLQPWFLAGTAAGLVLAATALVLRRRMGGVGSHFGPGSAGVRRAHNRALLGEVVVIVAGATVLSLTGLAEYVSCWTYAIMSLHFLPLARVYRIALLRVTAHLGVLIAVGGAVLGATTDRSPIAFTGAVGASALLVSGVLQVRQARSAGAGHR